MPGQRLTLARAGKVELREASRQLFVVAVSTTLILLLGSSYTQVGKQFVWVMAPVIVVLCVVVLLGLLALLRSARRAAAGTHLAVDAGAGVVSGFSSEKTVVRLRLEPLSAVKVLELHVRRGAGPSAKDPRSWATLELKLEDGTRLEAPDAWGPDDQADATEALLLPLGYELSRLCRQPLKVTHLWSGETRTVKP
ncbi:MAG: hypothetical protein JNK82_01515 [Myxococcaceae bacterium]|nr:hypothetical protein [Myxococcaceae bacterium]